MNLVRVARLRDHFLVGAALDLVDWARIQKEGTFLKAAFHQLQIHEPSPRPQSSWMTTRNAEATETTLRHMSRLPNELNVMIVDYVLTEPLPDHTTHTDLHNFLCWLQYPEFERSLSRNSLRWRQIQTKLGLNPETNSLPRRVFPKCSLVFPKRSGIHDVIREECLPCLTTLFSLGIADQRATTFDGWSLPGLAILENKASILHYLLQRYSTRDERDREWSVQRPGMISYTSWPVMKLSMLAAIRYTPDVYQLVLDWHLGHIDRAPPGEW
jgi:hypothetical protein